MLRRWILLLALACTAGLLPAAQEDPAETRFQEAWKLVQAGDLEAYLRVRPGLEPAGVSQPRRAYLDIVAIPPNSVEDGRRLSLIRGWLESYPEAESWRARLAIEAADTARVMRLYGLSTQLLDQAEQDLGPAPESPTENELHTHAWLHDVRGVLAREMGMYDVAAAEIERQRKWVDRSNDLSLEINLLFNRVTLAMSRNDPEQLRRLLEEAKTGIGSELLPQEQHRLQLNAGYCFLEEARRSGEPYDTAESYFQIVANAPDASHYQAGKARLNLAHIRTLQRNWKQAQTQLDAFRDRPQIALADGPRLELDLLYAALVGCLAADRPSAASHGAREKDAYELVERSLDQLLNSWMDAPINPGGIGYRTHYDMKLLIDASLRLQARRDGRDVGTRESLPLLLRLMSHGTLARALQLPVPTVDEVEAALIREGHGLLILHPGYARSWVFTWDQNGVSGEEIAPEYRLEERTKDLQAAVLAAVAAGQTTSSDVQLAAQALRDVLLPASIEAQLATWGSVAIVGSESLGWLPFELLQGASGEDYGTSHAVSYLPSLPLGVHLARPRKSATSGPPAFLLAAGTGASSEALERWSVADLAPHARRIRSLGDTYGQAAELLEGKGLTARRLRAALPRARVAQIVAHGIYSPERVRPAGLLLSPSDDASGKERGELWTEEMDPWTWPEVVLLSSCGVHRGPLRPGDDGRSLLAGSLLSGGARAVILPYADLELGAHLDLAHALHERIVYHGDSPEEALRQARSLAGPGLEKHLIHLVGLASEPLTLAPIPQPSSARTRWLWIGVLGAGLGLALVRRRRR